MKPRVGYLLGIITGLIANQLLEPTAAKSFMKENTRQRVLPSDEQMDMVPLSELQVAMHAAVANEDYVRAAIYRDKIKSRKFG